jgi:hypothetical protein
MARPCGFRRDPVRESVARGGGHELAPRWGMQDARQSLGHAGEDAACAELRRRGYTIVARRYRTRAGEIDIVARDGRTLVFVEVKARS